MINKPKKQESSKLIKQLNNYFQKQIILMKQFVGFLLSSEKSRLVWTILNRKSKY